MTSVIVHSDEPIALFGGGEANADVIVRLPEIAKTLVAADGGANLALAHNIMPNAVIGDFDSISDATLAALPEDVLHIIDEQDSTDFDKALRSISAPLILAIGFTGARIDHQLAAMSTLIARADQRCVIVGESEILFVCPPRLKLSIETGTVFSLFPMGQVEGTSVGLKWPIDGLVMAPDARVGTSNEVSGPIELTMDCARMLVILPISELDEVISALLDNESLWPDGSR